MKIPLVKKLKNFVLSHFDAVMPGKEEAYTLEDALSGEPAKPARRIPACCQRMAVNYKRLNDGDNILQMGWKKAFPDSLENVPTVVLFQRTVEHGEECAATLPIDHCPFCGEAFSFTVERTINLKQIEISETVTTLHTVEEEV